MVMLMGVSSAVLMTTRRDLRLAAGIPGLR